MIDLNNIKEEFFNFCKNFYSALINSSAFFFLKEKYYHLSPFYRKTFQATGWAIFTVVLLYYPASLFYSSWGHIRDFNTKQELMQDLMVMSASRSDGAGLFYSAKRDIVALIKQKTRASQIPEKQIQKIQKVSNKGESLKLSPSVKATAVEVAMEKLNLKEVVQYGQQMEQFSHNIKLMSIRIQEDPQKDNYFNVSYILHIFRQIKTQNNPVELKKSKL